MQRLGVARARPDGGSVVYDDVGPAGLQPLVDGSIELFRRCALGLNQGGVQIVVEQVQPQNVRCLCGLRHRHEVRRDGFDVLSAGLLRKRPHSANRVVLEMGDFGRHEAVDPSFGSHDVGNVGGLADGLHRFGDCLRITEVILLALGIGSHVLRRQRAS
jgi:hypothetical protein